MEENYYIVPVVIFKVCFFHRISAVVMVVIVWRALACEVLSTFMTRSTVNVQRNDLIILPYNKIDLSNYKLSHHFIGYICWQCVTSYVYGDAS